MNKTNRLGWEASLDYFTTPETVRFWRILTKYGREVDGRGYSTKEECQAAIDAEIKKRDRRNLASRQRHDLMTSLGLVRCRNGSYE